jgi:hypothetical protein
VTTDATLAYVFWHWRQPSIPASRYEALQRGFHEALAAHPPEGFAHSTSSALAGASWANGGAEAYQDRYVVRDSCALDVIDRAVVAGVQRTAHDGAARVAAGGTAGLYQARLGAPLATPRHALWFAKPAGTTYEELFARCTPLVRTGASVLWMRRMVLGPTPEFCLESVTAVTLPDDLVPVALSLRPVWP